MLVRGPTGTQFRTSICRRDVQAAGPFTAPCGPARPCRLDRVTLARRERDPIKVRSRSRKALERGWSRRQTLIGNLRRSSRRTDKVDETSSALRLPAATHRRMTSDNHPFELEPELRPLLTCTCSPQRLIRAFGRCAGKGWLLELGGQQQLGQRFGAIRSFGRLRVEGVSSSRSRGDEPGARCRDAAVCMALVAACSPT